MQIVIEFKLSEVDEKILFDVLRKEGEGDEAVGAANILQKHVATVKVQELQQKLRDDAQDIGRRFGLKG